MTEPETPDAQIIQFPLRPELRCEACGHTDAGHYIRRGNLIDGTYELTLVSCADLMDLDARVAYALLPRWKRYLHRRPEGWLGQR
jgi:hypothetical protein